MLCLSVYGLLTGNNNVTSHWVDGSDCHPEPSTTLLAWLSEFDDLSPGPAELATVRLLAGQPSAGSRDRNCLEEQEGRQERRNSKLSRVTLVPTVARGA